VLADSATVRLTQQVKAGGCASKLAPGTLAAVLARLPKQNDPNLLVGFETADDAGIYQISANLALVQTVDFFTPLVDDPFTFGQIAATNALSDVYAMGGRPVTALSVVCFPPDGDLDVLEQIMKGGMAKMTEASCVVVGGHSVRDSEIKFGYAVTGLIDPERVFTNAEAVVGDALILTKPIGTGVITTALKQGVAQPEWIADAVRSMTMLNREASELVVGAKGVHSMTDVTGFGLMGHCREMALASGTAIEIVVEQVPVIEGAVDAVRFGAIPAGLLANRSFAIRRLRADCWVPFPPMERMLCLTLSARRAFARPESDLSSVLMCRDKEHPRSCSVDEHSTGFLHADTADIQWPLK
jgi:selenide,water dikinase